TTVSGREQAIEEAEEIAGQRPIFTHLVITIGLLELVSVPRLVRRVQHPTEFFGRLVADVPQRQGIRVAPVENTPRVLCLNRERDVVDLGSRNPFRLLECLEPGV